MDFEYFFSPPAVIQEKKKYATFTVRDIGGVEEIKKWREVQAIKEHTYQVSLKDKDLRLEAYEAEIGEKLKTPTIHTSSWAEKYAFAQSERKRLSEIIESKPWDYQIDEPAYETPIVIKVVNFFKKLWQNANFS